MKITNNLNMQKILGTYRKNTKNVGNIKKMKQKDDQIQISENAREYQVALDAYKKLPDVRDEKVDKIKQQTASRNYSPSAEEIVEGMFDRKI
ncbi:flagellar biosynthesis anti-sigma factor FlgM [Crassaminicella profunda]|uniref:flagellar biosynthesis anti-sigma factor FlgM n=1 Tax=Crassaminicella profunda TaxID=1286698 RepID=UPI001CA61A06|nr:flagellar biosynthesis anti-sigma factor FlgM [Crassaminicella profunda]QZY54322.1 flagellar biosynthesis anti-sigma factor FlgM [Crassaminicella profunda]